MTAPRLKTSAALRAQDFAEQRTAMKTIKYTYRGQVERGNGSGYQWHSGYSETSSEGFALYPWMTERECQADARAHLSRPFFVYPKPNLPPLSDDLKAAGQSEFVP